MRCEFKACSWPAVGNTKYCASHQPEPIKQGAAAELDIEIVSLASVPPMRSNEVAAHLLTAVKVLGEGKAIKVKLAKFSKPNLACTQRYALATGIRIGVRFVGAHAYLWKMNEEEIRKVAEKASRLAAARAKKGKKS